MSLNALPKKSHWTISDHMRLDQAAKDTALRNK
jgi:hypothetical protein